MSAYKLTSPLTLFKCGTNAKLVPQTTQASFKPY